MNYYIIYKPYKVLSQFTTSQQKKCLDSLNFNFPKDVYPLGRLDENSEGLLILTNDKKLNFKLLDPSHKHKRIYLVQIQGVITNNAIKSLESGVEIALDNGPYQTKPCKAKRVKPPEYLPLRQQAISKNLLTSWIQLTLTEGKYHQVRKMTAGVGFPCLRLIRIAIEDLRLEKMEPGDVRELKRNVIYNKLQVDQAN